MLEAMPQADTLEQLRGPPPLDSAKLVRPRRQRQLEHQHGPLRHADSLEQGAEVSINGVVQGRTPLVIRDLGAGSRVVRLELPGYERWSWAVAVVANKRTPLTVKLRPESRGAGNQD